MKFLVNTDFEIDNIKLNKGDIITTIFLQKTRFGDYWIKTENFDLFFLDKIFHEKLTPIKDHRLKIINSL